MMIPKTFEISASSDQATYWKSIKWKEVRSQVKRLQMRIAKAVREKKYGKVKALQWILVHAYCAKLLAVKRVADNSGGKTPGIDKVVWRGNKAKLQAVQSLKRRGYQPQPLRRFYIPKKNDKMRPLSIPIMKDRAMQALHALTLQPVSESLADKNSYGFREGRSCADAIGQCFCALAKSYQAQWVLEADIKSCFDGISHDWMLDHIPMDKRILKQWLKAGYVENGRLYPTDKGTPQGGVISPLLANMTLDGLEKAVRDSVPKRGAKVNVIRYADDFIVTAGSKELLEEKVKPIIVSFLQTRGLELSEKKTTITHIRDGLDFLGQNLRKYGRKLRITPSKSNVKALMLKVRQLIKAHLGSKADVMVYRLNALLRGWINYHRHIVAKNCFFKIDRYVTGTLMRWARRRHHETRAWIKKKYFFKPARPWNFSVRLPDKKGVSQILSVHCATDTVIQRYRKVQAEANPYDPNYTVYFEKRRDFSQRIYTPRNARQSAFASV